MGCKDIAMKQSMTPRKEGVNFKATYGNNLKKNHKDYGSKVKSLQGCTNIDNIPSLLKEPHKYDCNFLIQSNIVVLSLIWKSCMMTLAIESIMPSVNTMLWELLGRFSPTILNLSTLKVNYNPYGVKTRGQ